MLDLPCRSRVRNHNMIQIMDLFTFRDGFCNLSEIIIFVKVSSTLSLAVSGSASALTLLVVPIHM